MEQQTAAIQAYFDEPRLRMTLGGRFVVRVTGYLGYLFVIAAAPTFLFSDIPFLFWSGAIIGLFLLDRVFHYGEGDRPITELPRAGRVNLASCLRPAAYVLLERAHDRSKLLRRNFLLELAHTLAETVPVRQVLMRVDIAPAEFIQKIEELIKEHAPTAVSPRDERREGTAGIVEVAFRSALANNHQFIEIGDLFAALAAVDDPLLKRLFSLFTVEAKDLEQAYIFTFAKSHASFFRTMGKAMNTVTGSRRIVKHQIMNRAWTSRPTPTLDAASVDLTDLARRGDIGFLVGHDEEYQHLINVLGRPVNPNVLLVGDVGIGKGTLVAHLAFDLVRDKVPRALFDKRLVELHIGALVAGAPQEELQARVARIADEIVLAGNIVLFIPDIHNLVHTSGGAFLSAADALIPIIMNNAFPVLGGTYPREFKQLVEPRGDFMGVFEVIHMKEIGEEEARKILIYQSLSLEAETGVVVSFGAVRAAVRFSKKFLHEKPLPGSASELVKEAVALAVERGEKAVGPDHIARLVEEKVNIPVRSAGEGEAETLLHLEKLIHEQYVDQEEAVTAIANALREYRSGLARPGGPIASFLFVGPTGVGKTELAKIIARLQFGSEKAMARFDMTEYQDKQSVYRFIGSPDGSILGSLTEVVREKPFSLILLDEFEKAFPDILNLFLQVLDDGRLTDGLGRVVDFQNTIVIATSNAHSDIINEALAKGESVADIAEYVRRKLVDVFRPELLNRFSDIIVFKNLGIHEVETIARLNLAELARSLEGQAITLVPDAAAVRHLAKLGYDPAFGARPLRRAIEEHVRSPLAEKILKKEIGRGSRVTLGVLEEKITFTVHAQ